MAIELPIEMDADRRWRVGEDAGEVFADGEDFNGITLAIELRDADEAAAIIRCLIPPGLDTPDAAVADDPDTTGEGA